MVEDNTAWLIAATFALALFTFALAWSTHRLAKHAEADLRTQLRPMLAPGIGKDAANPLERNLQLRVRNIGRGPALRVRAQLETPPSEQGAPPRRTSPRSGFSSLWAPDDEHQLIFEGPTLRNYINGGHAQLLLDYEDLAGRPHSTAIIIALSPTGKAQFYDARVWEDHTVTTHGPTIYPQSDLTDASPSPIYRGLRRFLPRGKQ